MISKKKERGTVVGYFALFYLMFYFLLIFSCENCWNWDQYNPFFFAFVFSFVATYFVFLTVRSFNHLLAREEARMEEIENALKIIEARKNIKIKKKKVKRKTKKK